MARILALDFGESRTGIAVTDPLQLIASGLTTVKTPELMSFLKKYMEQEQVESIVVGQPRRMNNEFSSVEEKIQEFLNALESEFPKTPVIREDERFTSKIAFQSMLDGGVKKKDRRKKEVLDQVSATVILQSYLYNR